MAHSSILRILHVDPERGLGGGERQVLGLMRHLAAAGHHQAVACDPDGRLVGEAATLGVGTRALRVRNHADVLAGRRLARLLASEPYDIVHFHTARAHALVPFLRFRHQPCRVVTRRMDYPLRGAWYARWLYNRGVDAVVAISEGVRAVLVAGGVDPTRIEVIRSGVEIEDFAATDEKRASARDALGLDDTVAMIAVVAALEYRKGHDVLLEAVAGIADPTIRLCFAGEGSRMEELRKRALDLALADRVAFLGRIDDVRPILAAADVVAMPSRQEGLGVAVLEAMAAGRPVVASAVGGLPEAVGRDAGILVPPEDVLALRAALERVLGDRALGVRLAIAARKRVRAGFAMVGVAQAMLGVYDRVMAETHGHDTPAS